MASITLYTLQNCIICNELKGRLKSLNIDYKEYIIDDGSMKNNIMGDNLEARFFTSHYPIVKLKNIYLIWKTDLEEQKGIIIFQDIEDLINKIKTIL